MVALPLLVELLERDAYNFEALIALGETLLALGRREDAAYAFQRVLRFEPRHAGALYQTGLLLAAEKRWREAIVCWERAIDAEPAGDYARQARREMRSAQDLLTVFGARAEAR